MALASGLSRAALLVAAGACVALACSSTTIDLLPERTSERGGSSSGGTNAGQSGAGAHSATDTGGATQAGSGTEAGGGKPGGAAGSVSCHGGACGGGSDTGGVANNGGAMSGCPFGACQECVNDNQCPDWQPHCSKSFGNVCVQCDDEFGCHPSERCNLSIGRCAPVCERDDDCGGRLCDPILKACVPCSAHEQCLSDQNENTRRCVFGRCSECADSLDCPSGPREICNNGRCAECEFDADCDFDQHCEQGTCE